MSRARRARAEASAIYIFPFVMCVLLIVRVGAIKVARSRSGTTIG
jgi:hypothetical protein